MLFSFPRNISKNGARSLLGIHTSSGGEGMIQFTGRVSYPTTRRGEWPAAFYRLWKKIFCSRGFHLFDEVCSLDRHELYCDACGLTAGLIYLLDEDVLIEMDEEE
jgi:hypothetical protein